MRLQQDIKDRNDDDAQRGEERKAALRTADLATSREELKRAEADLAKIDAQLSDARRRYDSANREFFEWQRKVICEQNAGAGCPLRGDGPKAKDSRSRMQEAGHNSRQAESDVRALEGRRAAAEGKLEEAKRLLHSRETYVQEKEQEIDRHVQAQLEQFHNDPWKKS
jgi:hypothetical protein